MRQTSSNTDQDTPCSVFGSAVGGQATMITRLEAGGQEGGGLIGRSAGAHALKRQPTCFGKGSPLCHLNLFHVGLPYVVRGATST